LIVLSGVISGLSVFTSFSLIVLPIFIILIPLLESIRSFMSVKSGKTQPPIQPLMSNTKILLYAVGFVAVNVAFFFLLHYNVFENYRFAMLNHQTFKISNWSIGTTLYIGFLDILEFALWVSGLGCHYSHSRFLMQSKHLETFQKVTFIHWWEFPTSLFF
jgi:hypothetical protein